MRNLILLPLYYLVIAPISLLIRLVHDPLQRSWRPSAQHYWYYHSPSNEDR
jgi:hypothetical protein